MNTEKCFLADRSAIELLDLHHGVGRGTSPHAPIDLGPDASSALEALPQPVEILVPRATRPASTAIVHSYTTAPSGDQLLVEANGLRSLTAPAAIIRLLQGLNLPLGIALIDEMCGTYRRPRIEALVGYSNAYPKHHAHFLPMDSGPTTCRSGSFYGLKPLLTTRDLGAYIAVHPGERGIKAARRILPFCADGLASYIETEFHMLAFLPLRYGGCALPRPAVNHRIDLPSYLAPICEKPYIVADNAWTERRVAIELLGASDHGGDGITDTSVREKVYSELGWKCLTLTKRELEATDLFMHAMRLLSRELGVRLRTDIPNFRQRQCWLRGELCVRSDETPPNIKSHKDIKSHEDYIEDEKNTVPLELRSMSFEESHGRTR